MLKTQYDADGRNKPKEDGPKMNVLRKWCAAALAAAMLLGAAKAERKFADFSETYSGMFLQSGTAWTESSYQSENMLIRISAERAFDTDVYVAQIWLKTPECLQRAFGGEGWNDGSEKLDTLARKSGAVLALTGDNGHHFKAGYEVGNGYLWRSRGNHVRDLCVVYTDGTMQIHYAEPDYELIDRQMAEGLIWQTFVFGPALLDENGKAIEDFSGYSIRPDNPRAVLGYYEPGHFCLVQVDGRSTVSKLEEGALNDGMRLEETAQYMEALGCKAAYNLDGGQTAALWFGGSVISTPFNNGRAMGDAIVLCEPGKAEESPDDFLVE